MSWLDACSSRRTSGSKISPQNRHLAALSAIISPHIGHGRRAAAAPVGSAAMAVACGAAALTGSASITSLAPMSDPADAPGTGSAVWQPGQFTH
jgi:hypothetical protein